MFLTIFSVLCGNLMAQEAKTVTWLSSSNDALSSIINPESDLNIQISWSMGTNDNKPKYEDGSVKLLNGNIVSIKGLNDDVTISKIVFTFSSGAARLSTCDSDGKNVSENGITNDATAKTTTWEGEANNIMFRAKKQDGNRFIQSIAVTYTSKGTTPVTQDPKLTISQDNIADTYDMDINGVFVVYYENQGTVAAENAKLTLYVDGAENVSKAIGTLNIGANSQNFWNAKYDVTKFEAGEHTVKLSLTADNAEAVNIEKTVTFTKKAPQPAFTISANAVTVPYNTESYTVEATLTETNNVAATDVKVELRKGLSEVLATQTVATLAAKGNTKVNLTVAKELFETGTKTYYIYVNDKYLTPVDVTFEEAPVVETKSLEITSVDGTIKLGEESNTLRIIVKNTGNVDITDAAVVLKKGDTTLGQGTVSAKAGLQGWNTIAVDKTGL